MGEVRQIQDISAPPLGLIIFDCDGVLVDSEPISMRILLETIAEAGGDIEAAEAYDTLLGKSLSSVCELLRLGHGIDIDAAALERMRRRLYQAFREELQPIPGIAEMLAGLDRKVCVASSSQPERIGLCLEVTGLARFFGGDVFSATMVDRGKPAPDLFLHAARTMQVAPGDCLVIEDSPAGVEAALAAGMGVFGFTGGSHARNAAHRERLSALAPDHVFDSMRDLPALIAAVESERAEEPGRGSA